MTKSRNARLLIIGVNMTNAQKKKDALLYVAIACGAYAVFTLRNHMKSCEDASKNTKRALWVVLSAVIGEIVIKGMSLIHFGG